MRRALLSGAAVVAVDVISSLTWLSEGRVGKRPLPPFGVEIDGAQREVLERLESGRLNPNTVTGFDRELGWCVRPGASVPDGTVHVNRLGARAERDYADLPPPQVLRLATFGDSFTFGDEVRDSFTYQAFLESLRPELEVLNFGVPAYGTDQALLRMERDGLAGARVVVVGLLLENIGRNVNRYRPLWNARTLAPLAKPRFVLEDGELVLVAQPYATAPEFARAVRDGSVLAQLAPAEYWSGRPVLPTGRWSALGRLAAGWIAYGERDPRKLWLDREGEPRRVTLALLERFRESARRLGALEFLVLVLPMREELADFRRTGSGYWSGLAEELSGRGLPALDLAPALAQEDARCEQDPARPTLYVAAHLSSHGNRVIALEIERWLVGRGRLPARTPSAPEAAPEGR
ncbi:MAG: hypothetical protein IPK67_05485 [Planctomycetes bacterium]|nr:hypothetical protein [Planctomycetota bacterium]